MKLTRLKVIVEMAIEVPEEVEPLNLDCSVSYTGPDNRITFHLSERVGDKRMNRDYFLLKTQIIGVRRI